jgi:hypothetical protein
LLLALVPLCAGAQALPLAWPDKPQGTVLYAATTVQFGGAVTHGNAGEVIVAWADMRDGYGRVMLQKLDSHEPDQPTQWRDELPGVGPVEALVGPVCQGAAFQPVLAADGAGGAFVLWQDATAETTGALRLLRVTDGPQGTGAPAWPDDILLAEDVPVPQEGCREEFNRCRSYADENRNLCVDDNGGVWVLWRLEYQGLYLQHVTADGELDPDFPTTGLPLPTDSYGARLCPDGQGNALVFYTESDSLGVNMPLRALGVRPDGTWLLPGITRRLSAANSQVRNFDCRPQGDGATLVAWTDYLPGSACELRAQLLVGGLTDSWAAEGQFLGLGNGSSILCAGDGPAGPFYTVNATDTQWTARKFNQQGQPQWGEGVRADFFEDEYSDQVGAAEVVDGNLIYLVEHNANLHLQQLSEHGGQVWSPEQTRLTQGEATGWYWALCPDDESGLFCAWMEARDTWRALRVQRRDLAGQDLFPEATGLPGLHFVGGGNPVLLSGRENPLLVWSGDSLYASSVDAASGMLRWPSQSHALTGDSWYSPGGLETDNGIWLLNYHFVGPSGQSMLRLQRLDLNGQVLTPWQDVAPGSLSQPEFWSQEEGRLVQSGGRLYVPFLEYANPSGLRAQCFSESGEALWGERGRELPTHAAVYPRLTGAAAAADGGLDYCWTTTLNGLAWGYLQHMDADGNVAYPDNGGRGLLLNLPLDPWSRALYMLTLPDGTRVLCSLSSDSQLHVLALDATGQVLWTRNHDDVTISRVKLEADSQGRILLSWSHGPENQQVVTVERLSPNGQLEQSWQTPDVGLRYVGNWQLLESGGQQALVVLGNRLVVQAGYQVRAYLVQDSQPLPSPFIDAPLLEAPIWQSAIAMAPAPEGDLWLVWEDDRGSSTSLGWQARLQRLDVLDLNTGVGDPAQPAAFRVLPNHPNPFNPETTLSFHLAQAGPVRLEVFNLAGQLVRVLQDGELGAGLHQLRFDGRDDAGRELGSGLYLYQVRVGERQEARRMLLLR